MNDYGATNLIVGIVKQAVDDYVSAECNIWSLNHEVRKHIEAIKREDEKKIEKYFRNHGVWLNKMTNEEAEAERQDRVRINEDRKKECERFFRGKWYRTLTEIPGERVLQWARKTAEEKIKEKEEALKEAKCDTV